MLQRSFSFNSLSSDKIFLACCTNTGSNIMQWKGLRSAQNSSLLLKVLELLICQFNNAIPENSNDAEKIFSSKYYNIDKLHNIKISKSISLLQINGCSLNKNFNDFQHICTKTILT